VTIRSTGRSARASPLRRDGVLLGVLWIGLGSILGEFANQVGDYIDFDAGRYEHLAISIARTHSLVPRVDGVNIHSYSQLYPLFLAPFFAHGFVSTDFRNAGIAGAYLMSSACIPAFLLTRRLTSLRLAPFAVAVLTICMPWIVTSMFLMTEIAAYPAFAWAIYAMVVAISAPSKKHDLLVLLALLLAYGARGELIGLAFVLPLALIAFAIGRAPGAGVRERLASAGRSIGRGHPVLLGVYAVGGAASLVLYTSHRLSSVIGIYGVYSNSAHLAYRQLPRALVEHLATFSLGVGVVPLVIALAWIGANVIRPPRNPAAHAFACVGVVACVELFVQATNFDLTVNAYIHDRFLMYFVPVVLIGTAVAVEDARRLRWSLVVPLALVVAGFTIGEIPAVTWKQFPWFDLDTPVSTVYRVLAFHFGGLTPVRAGLAGLAVIGTGLFFLGAREFRTRPLALGVFAYSAVAMLFATTVVFQRTFDVADTNRRPVTMSEHGTLDWIDEAVGPGSSVTAIPYPVSSDWFVNAQRWVDFEFFNKSIQRVVRVDAGGQDDPFDYIGIWFPKLTLHPDPNTGAIASSPTRWVVQSVKETRLRIAGPAKLYAADSMLIDAGDHWRLAWRTSGLYDDGWTRPDRPMSMRVYASRGQRRPVLRVVSLVLRAPVGQRRAVTLGSGRNSIHLVATESDTTQNVDVCVPPNGYGELRMTVEGSSAAPGDLATLATSELPRRAGIFIASLSADNVGGNCDPRAAQPR
jgi:hypothetical protein